MCLHALVIATWIRVVSGFPSGAPLTQCTDMTPAYPHAAGQIITSPYLIKTTAIAAGGYIPGQTYSSE